MKRIITRSLLVTLSLIFILGCDNKQNSATKVRGSGLPKAKEERGGIAFIDVDSLMKKYEFSRIYTLRITEQRNTFAAQINKKGEALQRSAENFQQKLQEGRFNSQDEAVKAQQALQRQQQEIQKMQETLTLKLEKEQESFNKALRDSINHFLIDYNRTRKFSMILSKAGDNILYADSALDITDEVITGLNKRYVHENK